MSTSGLAVVIMGVSGSGKSFIGELLAKALGCTFVDADDFHSAESKELMRRGIPLTDEDRIPWLEALEDVLRDYILHDKVVVLACSALKPLYRNILRRADYEFMLDIQERENNTANLKPEEATVAPILSKRVKFVLLNGSFELFFSRLEKRFKEGAHFMPPSLLKSQMDSVVIEENERVISIDASMTPAAMIDQIRSSL